MTPKACPKSAVLTLLDLVDTLPSEVAHEACAGLTNSQLADLLDAFLWASASDVALLRAVALRLRD